ncbi:MAG: zinc-binding alcohol dehydrogenase [Clostridia bacterium]|nr:zinc-binding alcohol dehydrogenase [Clostridia bacterium]
MDKNYQVVFTAQNKVELSEVPMPEPSDEEVLVKTIVTQISTGTELTRLMGNVDADSSWTNEMKYPTYPGYSNVGKVVGVGKNVDPSMIGKIVYSGCPHAKYGKRMASDLVPGWSYVTPVPDGVDYDEAVFAAVAGITLGSARVSQIKLGETAVVFGAGLIGQFVARFAKLAGALNVIVADVSDFRLSLLPDDCCFISVNSSKTDVAEFIKEHNNGNLADVVFETTGYHPLIQSEIECLVKNGRIIITSSPKGRSTVDFDYCNRKGITIIGAHNSAVHPKIATTLNPWTAHRDKEYYLQLLQRKQLSVKNMITHKANYKDAAKMYEMLMEDRTKALAVNLYWED